MFDFTGKTVLVTGGAEGIGKAVAKCFLNSGAKTIIFDKKRPSYSGGHYFQVDVSDLASLRNILSQNEQSLSEVDILVNNAGIYPSTPILQMTEEEWDLVLNTNLKSVFLISQALTKLMIQTKKKGSIINILSNASFKPVGVGLAHYESSKAGLLALTKNMALEFSEYGIKVNAICPDGIKTEGLTRIFSQVPKLQGFLEQKSLLRRLGEPAEVANVVLFLASDFSSFMQGSILIVDGGMMLSV